MMGENSAISTSSTGSSLGATNTPSSSSQLKSAASSSSSSTNPAELHGSVPDDPAEVAIVSADEADASEPSMLVLEFVLVVISNI
jgi:hypothetical protein